MSIIPPKFNRILGKGEAETPVSDSTSSIYANGTCPAYNIEILEDVGRSFASALLDIIDDNPISRLTLSKFKNLEGVRNDVADNLGKNIKLKKGTKAKNVKQPPKEKQKNIIPKLEKPVKPKRAASKAKSYSIKPLMKVAITKKAPKMLAQINEVSTANSSSIRARPGGSADMRMRIKPEKVKKAALLQKSKTRI